MKKLILTTVTATALAGCSSPILKTTAVPAVNSEAKVGSIYYLPKTLIPITIVLDNDKSKPAAVGGAEKSTGTSSQTVTNNITVTTALEKPKATPVVQDKDNSTKQYVVTIGLPKVVSDTRYSYFLEYNSEAASDDVVSIGVGANQLLQTTTSVATDQSGNAAVLAVKLLGEIAKLSGSGGLGGAISLFSDQNSLFNFGEPIPKKVEKKQTYYACSAPDPISLDTYIDPSAPDGIYSIKELNDNLQNLSLPILFNIQKLRSNTVAGISNASDIKPGEEINGVRFRSTEPWSLKIQINQKHYGNHQYWVEVSDEKKGKSSLSDLKCVDSTEKSLIVMAPNDAPVFTEEVRRAGLVEKKTDLTIVDGMLTKIDVNKPSQLLAGFKLPLDMIKALASIPSEILSLRIKQSQDEGSLTKAQVDLLSNEIQKLKNEKLLQQEQKSPALNNP